MAKEKTVVNQTLDFYKNVGGKIYDKQKDISDRVLSAVSQDYLDKKNAQAEKEAKAEAAMKKYNSFGAKLGRGLDKAAQLTQEYGKKAYEKGKEYAGKAYDYTNEKVGEASKYLKDTKELQNQINEKQDKVNVYNNAEKILLEKQQQEREQKIRDGVPSGIKVYKQGSGTDPKRTFYNTKTPNQVANEKAIIDSLRSKTSTKYDSKIDIAREGAAEAQEELNKLNSQMDERKATIGKNVAVGAAGLAGLAGLGYLGYRLLFKKKKEKKDMKKSFSEEFCENKALISAANTVDMITLIDPVNYSEYSAGLISKITNAPLEYVAGVMNEVADFNAHFNEEKIDMFVDEVSNIYENFNEDIVQSYGEYLNSLIDFDEASAEAKVNDLSDLISLMDEDTIKELGTDYVAGVIASATDTNVDLLKNTIEKYLASDEKTEAKVEKAEEKTKEAAEATEDAKDAIEEDVKVAQEKFSEVFIKKDGQYFKFSDAVVTIPVKE